MALYHSLVPSITAN